MGIPAILAAGLSKRYRLGRSGGRGALRRLFNRFTDPTRPEDALGADQETWALRDVSFEITQGESVGIIGRNGAGKSTLLKVLSRITGPTEGYAEVKGRVGSLLEVGTGFHPDLTGRENIYLNGAILGVKRADIVKQFDEIVDFAEIGHYLDQPVKWYSSGMYTRLAFSVAAHLEPEILLVDEVLAVGDASFQAKSLKKMQYAVREGRTVLFVSHNLQAISLLTQRSIVLADGRCIYDGPTAAAIDRYHGDQRGVNGSYTSEPDRLRPKVVGVEVVTSAGGNVHHVGLPLKANFIVASPRPIEGAALSFQVVNAFQQPVIHLLVLDSEIPMCRRPGIYKVSCHIPALRLYLGKYALTVHFAERPGGAKFETLERVCPFEVVAYGKRRDHYWQPGSCAYLEEATWTCERLSDEPALGPDR
jgi:lipopolysaccharide transport system ATP-binding protein